MFFGIVFDKGRASCGKPKQIKMYLLKRSTKKIRLQKAEGEWHLELAIAYWWPGVIQGESAPRMLEALDQPQYLNKYMRKATKERISK